MVKHSNKTSFQEYLSRRISPNEPHHALLNFPRYLEIETVNACNARCPMCTIADWERGYSPMTDDLFNKIADEVVEHSDELLRVSLYRDGEPLIDKKLPERVARLKDGGVKITAISTNVSLLNEGKAKDLLNAGLDLFILSIDSMDKEIFESIRVRLKFEEVMENALKLIELRDKMRPETSIWVRMIRQPSNQHEWPAYRDFWSSKVSENDRVCYHNIFNWGGQLQDYKEIAPSLEPQLPCVALWSLMVVLCNGDVPLCNVDFNNLHSTGSVLNHSIEELWKSKLMNQRREWHLTGQKSKIDICTNCNVWDENRAEAYAKIGEDGDSETGKISQDYVSELKIQI